MDTAASTNRIDHVAYDLSMAVLNALASAAAIRRFDASAQLSGRAR